MQTGFSTSGLLMAYLRPQIRQVLLLLLLLLGGIGFELFNPQLLGQFIQALENRDQSPFLYRTALLFIGLAILQQVITVLATYLSERIGWNATNAMRADLTNHLLRLDLSFHKDHTPGELIERVDGDITTLADFFSQFVVHIFANVLLLIGILIVFWWINWYIGISLTGFALLFLFCMYSMRHITIKPWKVFRQVSAELYGFLEERFNGTEDIRSSGAHAYTLRQLYVHTRKRLQAARKARIISAIPWSFPLLAGACGQLIAILLSAWLYSRGDMSLATAFLIFFYLELLLKPIQAIINQLDTFQRASAGIARVRELFQQRSVLEDGPGYAFPAGALPVAFEDVSFGYNEDEKVLQHISFHLQPGEILGLLGRTGSGKTTIARLLLRLYDPTTGNIRLAEHNLREARIADLRKHIGIVTQDVQLFNASVRDNLTFFDHSIDDERIKEAIYELGLRHWFEALPEGLDTVLPPNGGGLSAGEAQLLAFARIFLRDPGLVILDEASSRLDPVTEHLLEQAIERLLRGRTAIIIAHRLRTIQRADSILILEHGQIREYGSRALLTADPSSHFTALLQTAHEEVLA
ncbi:ATP-binding cassette subfamily B protein [Thermosporothrix hazakensis]|uniref:ATP-binding cassette subfamily B protein n=1 Tax=Thermosporothrix hazakensis TaxID=644383 RepID=A0A326U1X9_THEHA|nr:ABC transporter ATP-binding protein [Thermosporothrix hazakensis]PZW22443.1 ATP-binding cassette subfamily B protein [Thermosporothrix hazakensis]GCE45501.1 helicase [Thermosporothrix hazakensis]